MDVIFTLPGENNIQVKSVACVSVDHFARFIGSPILGSRFSGSAF
jgi:hypothetical protein